MKYSHKLFFKTTLWLLGGVAISLLAVYYLQKSSFQKKADQIAANSEKFFFGYPDLGEHFYTDSCRYANSKKEFYDFILSAAWAEEAKRTMKDPFSNQNGDLLYVPVFSKANGICEGYLLISAGIDGKIDNQLPDSIYFETVNTLRFYNSLTPASTLSFRKFDLYFSLKDYLFGNKDLLVEYANGVEIFINNASQQLYTPATLMTELYPRGYTRLDCSVEGKAKRLNDSTIIVADKTNRVVCSMYKGRSAVIGESEQVKIVGKFRNRIDPANKTVYLKNCIVISK